LDEPYRFSNPEVIYEEVTAMGNLPFTIFCEMWEQDCSGQDSGNIRCWSCLE